MVMKTITNPKERLVDQHVILVYNEIRLYEAHLEENYRFGESQVFCLWWTMTTLQATPPTEQLVMQLGLHSGLFHSKFRGRDQRTWLANCMGAGFHLSQCCFPPCPKWLYHLPNSVLIHRIALQNHTCSTYGALKGKPCQFISLLLFFLQGLYRKSQLTSFYLDVKNAQYSILIVAHQSRSNQQLSPNAE